MASGDDARRRWSVWSAKPTLTLRFSSFAAKRSARSRAAIIGVQAQRADAFSRSWRGGARGVGTSREGNF